MGQVLELVLGILPSTNTFLSVAHIHPVAEPKCLREALASCLSLLSHTLDIPSHSGSWSDYFSFLSAAVQQCVFAPAPLSSCSVTQPSSMLAARIIFLNQPDHVTSLLKISYFQD